jgi:hypothetical protein
MYPRHVRRQLKDPNFGKREPRHAARKDRDTESGDATRACDDRVAQLGTFVGHEEHRNADEEADKEITHIGVVVRADRIEYGA